MKPLTFRFPSDRGVECYGVIEQSEDRSTKEIVFSVSCSKCGVKDEVIRFSTFDFEDPRRRTEVEVMCHREAMGLPVPVRQLVDGRVQPDKPSRGSA